MSKLTAIGSIALLAMAAFTGTAGASPIVQTTVVSTDPANFTPRVTTGVAVYKLLQVGNTMFAGGEFSQIQNSNRTSTFNRNNLFSFDATNGTVNPLSVTFDAGLVWGLASSGSSLYVGGTFHSVNGVARRGLVKINAATGAVDTAFDAHLTGAVQDVQLVGGRLIIGGKFAKRLQAVDLVTGADTGYLNLSISGTVDDNAGATDIYRFAVNPAGTRLVAIGNFTTVAGSTRYRAFMLNLGATSGTLATWYYTHLNERCRAASLPAQLRDVDFSPDGSLLRDRRHGLHPAGGPGEHRHLRCHVPVRDGARPPTAPVTPTWRNYTGGDTLHSVVVTNAAVYIQGHERWVNSTSASGCFGGCVSRPGIAALDPVNGLALPWNPTKDRGVGGKDLLLTPAGLWVASDTIHIGGEIHERLAFMPLP